MAHDDDAVAERSRRERGDHGHEKECGRDSWGQWDVLAKHDGHDWHGGDDDGEHPDEERAMGPDERAQPEIASLKDGREFME